MNNYSSTEAAKLINRAEATKLAKQVSDPNAKLVRYFLQPYGDKQLGYLGSHHRLTLQVQPGDDDSPIETHDFFVKAVPYENPGEAEYVREKGVFEQESLFFREIVPKLMDGCDIEGWAPKCYLANSDFLVLEDLGKLNFTMPDKLFDETTAKSAISTLARFHASSILTEARLGRSLRELYPNAFKEMTFMGVGKNQGWVMSSVDPAVAVADKLGLDSSKIAIAFDKLMDVVKHEKENPPKSNDDKSRVICHGDLWTNNIMFDDKRPPGCRFVDFQFVRYAPAAQDLAIMLYLCTTREFRLEWERELIEHYYREVRETVKRNDAAIRIPTIDELRADIEEQRLRAAVSAVIYKPVVYLDPKYAPNVLDDPVGYDRFQYRDRRDKVLEVMQLDEAYRARVEEAVRDLVDYCERL